MIDRGTFNNEWTYLCERFRMTGEKEPSSVMRGRYYEYLSARMDTAAFVEAAGRIYCEAEFFPKPADFVPPQSAKQAAIAAWEDVLPLLRNFSAPLDSLDEPARRAVRAMGGLSRIGADVDGIPFRRAEFLNLYQQYAGADDGPPPLTGEGRRVIEQAMAGGTSGDERSGAPGRLPATKGA